MIAAPRSIEHSPWLNYEALAGTLRPAHVETFDWSQRYGPLNWPRTGREVLDVQAQQPGLLEGGEPRPVRRHCVDPGLRPAELAAAPAARLRRRIVALDSQTIAVTLRAMRTTDVIARRASPRARTICRPTSPPATARAHGLAGSDLQPGDSYTIATYSPHPTRAQLNADVSTPPDELLAGYRSMLLPAGADSLAPPEVTFPPFHSGLAVQSITGIYGADGTDLVRHSAYARAYALAQRLARRASTPYAFVGGVMRYLGHGFRYNETPPPSRYPLETFLFNDKVGYCQQFAGAMALLLRMGGVPARVSAGFTPGSLERGTDRYVVTDIDAHAWVEAWFPHYGWVRFDPTPGAAPARGGHVALLPALKGSATGATPV